MSFTTFITCFLAASTTGWAQYVLEDDFLAGGNFFEQFSFWDSSDKKYGPDPTHGYVNYVNQDVAKQNGYITTSSDQIYIGTDAVNVTGSAGRNSVRITSNKSYSSGLVILDLDHMPGGMCGTWPAFWMVGPNWPNAGEIDIIEGVNSQATNAMTLHTGPDCAITDNGAFSGSIVTPSCDVNAAAQNANAGCSIDTPDTQSYGAGFNANNGGVYATNYAADAISVYFFPRGAIPADIAGGSPDPSGWGKPLAQFQGGCDIAEKIHDQQIVFDLTFCGDWAGQVWASDSACSAKASTCNDFVQNNPAAFQDAYWAINSLKVYQSGGGTTSSSVAVYSSASTVPSLSVPAPVSSSVWAASYSSSANPSPTTFALSSKPSSSAVPVTPPYSSGNATDSPYPTLGGASTGSAVFASSVGTVPYSIPVPTASPTSVSDASAAVPTSSPPETIPSSAPSSVQPVAGLSTTTTTSSYDWRTHSWRHQHTPAPQAVRRHLGGRGHKRHGGGLH
ncbi:hypothetical protein LTR53_001312 [Teratosphaeriaceae sp. CCFEE 6253]|nr:hypothetical protein LTR53_001312 [Teratosphaeriaceae sp. CCFEE 6253]